MERIWSTELAAHVGADVRLAGWLHHQRRLSQVTFLLLRDGAGIAQVVVESDGDRDRLAAIQPESVLEVGGRVVANEQAPGGVELHDPTIVVLSATEAAPPFELRRPELSAQLPTLLDHAAVSLRHPRRRAAARLAAASVHGFRTVLDDRRFTEIHTPKVVASATEGGANVFPIDWFGRTAFLAQSPQFYKQTMVGVFERVYEVAPVFRAEPHDTVRHLAEYVSLDAEVGFISDHTDVMRLLQAVIAGMVDTIAARAAVDGGAPRAGASRRARHHPRDPLRRRPTPDRGSDRRARPSASPTWRRATSAGSASGRAASTARTSCS